MSDAGRKDKLYVASLSGGKDSTAMVLRLMEEKWPLDLILFCDTGLEFPEMYAHVERLEKELPVPVVWLKEEKGFEHYFLCYRPERKNQALADKTGMSWAGPRNRWCTGYLKTDVIDRYLAGLKKQYEIVQYIGIAADEPQRVREYRYPLVEWGMTEKDCLEYCYARGYDWGRSIRAVRARVLLVLPAAGTAGAADAEELFSGAVGAADRVAGQDMEEVPEGFLCG